jgi:hypothetical protein
MTPAERITYLRAWLPLDPYGHVDRGMEADIAAVCDLAERALLADAETEAVRAYVTFLDRAEGATTMTAVHLQAVLRRLLGE